MRPNKVIHEPYERERRYYDRGDELEAVAIVFFLVVAVTAVFAAVFGYLDGFGLWLGL